MRTSRTFITSRRQGAKSIVVSTAWIYEISLRQFLAFVTDPRYGWPPECRERFGVTPTQLLHESNSIVHVTEHEGNPLRRPLTYDEIHALFDAADARVEQIRAHHRKGATAAMRDAALLKTIYAFGIRRREAWGLDLADLRHNPKALRFGRLGALFVRWGKSSLGSPPKRRTVLTVPEMDWIVPVLEQWCSEVRSRFGADSHPAVGDRTRRPDVAAPDQRRLHRRPRRRPRPVPGSAFPAALLITHLVEFDYPEKFVSAQVRHSYAASTAIYTGVSDEYRNRLLQRSLAKLPDLWGQT